MEKFYKLSEKQLLNLVKDSVEMAALNRGGVDNWHWYGDSIRYFVDEYQKENGIDPEENEDYGLDEIAREDMNMYEEI